MFAWLISHPIELLTLALLITTIYYAWQTRHTVREMAAARVESIRPAVRLDFGILHPEDVYVIVENVGGGPALGLSLGLTVKGFTKPSDAEALTIPLLRVGECRRLFYPTWGGKELMQLKSLREVPVRLELTGTCTDVEHREYAVHDVIDFGQVSSEVAQLPPHLTKSDDVAAVDRLAAEVSRLQARIQMRGEG